MSAFTPGTLPPPASRRPLRAVEALGGTLYVRPMGARDWRQAPKDDDEAFAVYLVIRSTVYADGSRVWPDDGGDLEDYPPADLVPLVTAAIEVNGSKQDMEDRKGN